MVKVQKIPKDAIAKLYPKYVGPYRVKTIQFNTLGLVPLKQPGQEPKFLHCDHVRPCQQDTTLDNDLEELLMPFTDPASVDPHLETEAIE